MYPIIDITAAERAYERILAHHSAAVVQLHQRDCASSDLRFKQFKMA